MAGQRSLDVLRVVELVSGLQYEALAFVQHL